MTRAPTPPPFSLRLTFEERARLERDAADMPLGAYIRKRVFDGNDKPRTTRNKRPVEDHKALAELLARLGRTHLSSNLNQLARSANIGTLFVEPETEQALVMAAQDVRQMRDLLIKALGLEERP